MLRKIAILTIILAQVVYTQAQEIKFGVHVDPYISFLDSDYQKVAGDAVNGGTSLGVEVEYRIGEGGNAAFTFGLDFSINQGGSLLYTYGGKIFNNSEFDNAKSFKDIGGIIPMDTSGAVITSGIDMFAYTKVNYRINYIDIPVGFKFRTDEFGGSYMRAFFHIPLIKIMIPVTASAKIFAPEAAATGFATDQTGYGVPQASDPNSVDGLGYVIEPDVWKDITPLQISIGAGAGVEFAPSDPDGLKLYAGIYYNTGIIDVTGGFSPDKTTFTEAQTGGLTNLDSQIRNPRNALHNISLRIGCIF